MKPTPPDQPEDAALSELEIALRQIVMEIRADGHSGDIKPKATYTDKIKKLFREHERWAVEVAERRGRIIQLEGTHVDDNGIYCTDKLGGRESKKDRLILLKRLQAVQPPAAKPPASINFDYKGEHFTFPYKDGADAGIQLFQSGEIAIGGWSQQELQEMVNELFRQAHTTVTVVEPPAANGVNMFRNELGALLKKYGKEGVMYHIKLRVPSDFDVYKDITTTAGGPAEILENEFITKKPPAAATTKQGEGE